MKPPAECQSPTEALLLLTLGNAGLIGPEEYRSKTRAAFVGSLDADFTFDFENESFECEFTCRRCLGRISLYGPSKSALAEMEFPETCSNPMDGMISVPKLP